MTDQQLRYFVRANLGNPAALASRAKQEGFGIPDIARVSGYTPSQIEQHFARAGVALPGPTNAPVAPDTSNMLPGGSAGSGVQANGSAGAPASTSMPNAVGMGGAAGQTGVAAGPAPSGLTQATPTGATASPPTNPVATTPSGAPPQQQDAAQAAQVLQAMAQNGQQGAQADSNPDEQQRAFQQGFDSVRTNPYAR